MSITILLNLLLKYWKYIVPLFLLLILIGWYGILMNKIHRQTNEIDKLNNEITMITMNYNTSQENYRVCAEANLAYKKATELREEELLKLKTELDKTAAANKALEKRISKLITEHQNTQGQIDQVDTKMSCEEQLDKYWKILTDYARGIQ